MMDKQKTRKVSKATGAELFGRGALKALTISIALAFGAAPVQVSAQETPVQISIPAQSLSNSLIQLGEQASLQIFYLPETVSGLNAPAVAGSLTPDQALRRLLVGTGIEVKRNGNTVSLSKPASGGTTQLAPIMVQGALDATTEDTGSYAAEAVTIGKGVQTLREIPQSVSVVTNKQLKDQNITSVAEALNQVPGVTSVNWDNMETFSARGFGMTTQQSGVPLQIGDAGYSYSSDIALYDRIEVIKGPSGLLTGTGEPGGSVNLVRKMPRDTFNIAGSLSAGSWNHRRAELDVTGPMNKLGTLRGRAVLAYQTEDKFTGAKDNKDKFLYGVLEYDLTPHTTLSLGASYLERDYTASYGLPLYSDGTGLPRDTYVGFDWPSSHIDKDIYLDLKHDFSNDWQFKTAYNYKESDFNTYIAQAQSAVNPVTGLGNLSAGRTVGGADSHSLDINVSGPIRLFGREHTLVFGYNRSEQKTHRFRKPNSSVQLQGWDILNDHDFSQYDSLFGVDRDSGNENLYRQSGVYTSARIKLRDPLTLVVGGRWSDYETKSRNFGTNATPWVTGANKASGEFTPYGGLVWDVNKQVTLYASYADTFVPNSQEDYTGKILEPRVGWQAEVGAKGQFFDGKLNASIAAFRIRDTNRPMVDPNNVGCGPTGTANCFIASGLIQSQGWEIEVSGSPAPGWDIVGGYTYTQAKNLENVNPDVVGTRYAAGTTPKHLFKLWTQYRFDRRFMNGAMNGWNIGAGVQVFSDTYTTAVHQGGYAVASLKLGYQINPNWDAALTINNMFDRKYYRILGYQAFNNFYGDPRSAMLTVRAKF